LARRGQWTGQSIDAPARQEACLQAGRRGPLAAKIAVLALCALIAGLAALLGGCSEKESFSPALVDGLGTDTLYKSIELAPVEEICRAGGASAGNPYESKRLVVCRWRGYQSMCFLRFSDLPDTTVEILQATLFLYASRVQSETPDNTFGIYTLADSLADTTVAWGTLPALDEQVATFSLGSADPSTIAVDSVLVDVTSLVVSWMREERENWGLAVKLEDDSPGDAILEFASREDATTRDVVADDDTTNFYVRPAIRVVYAYDASATSLALAAAPAAIDTSYLQALATEDTFAHTLLTPFPDTLLVCANGFPSRTFLRFDLSAVPQEASIIRAQLNLTLDIAASSFDSMTVMCFGLTEAISGYATAHGTAGSGSTTLSYASKQDAPDVAMDVTPLVQPQVSNLVSNYGLVVRSANEKIDLDFAVIASSRGDSADAPRLQLQYIVPPEPRIGGN
jgi:hypothetical protein